MADTWVPRGADDYAQAIESELPTGAAWPRDPDSGLMRWVAGCGVIWGQVDARAADLAVTEGDPRYTLEMLPEWERAFGLPDPCLTAPLTIPDRRNALVDKLTVQGGQSPAFFISAASGIGYSIAIYEFLPVVCGITRCGETRPDGVLTITHARCGVAQCGVDRLGEAVMTGGSDWIWQIGPPELRYYWKVKVLGTRVTWFRCGTGIAGQDHLAEIAYALDLECLIQRWRPAHTVVIFDYSAAGISGQGGSLDFSIPGNPLAGAR